MYCLRAQRYVIIPRKQRKIHFFVKFLGREIGFFRNSVETQVAEDHFSFEQVKSCSPPSGGCFWYRVPSKEQGKGPPERTKREGAVSRTEDASGGQVLLLARHASENASRTPGGCPQSVESAVLRALKMRRVPQEPVFGTEYLFCTGKAYFEHRVPLKTPSVQKKGVFMHRMPFSYRSVLS